MQECVTVKFQELSILRYSFLMPREKFASELGVELSTLFAFSLMSCCLLLSVHLQTNKDIIPPLVLQLT